MRNEKPSQAQNPPIGERMLPTPAMATGIEARLWSMDDIALLVAAKDAAPKRPATYRKRSDEISN